MSINCFLPCRKGSQRVPRKNLRPFANHKYGLIEIKLNQLISTKLIDKVILTTDDDEIIDYAESLCCKKLYIHKRCTQLSLSTTSTDDLIAHACDLINCGHILWTHVTSPFITSHHYDLIIEEYFQCLKHGYDSLMTTSEMHGFVWTEAGPLNYDRSKEKWPRTQTIKPLYEINSGVFLNSYTNYIDLKDRIGSNPYFYNLDKLVGFDIDWEVDFELANYILESGLVKI